MEKTIKTKTVSVNANRRRFLTTFALGASAVPFLSWSRGLLAEPTAPAAPGLCFSTKRVLGPNDFNYLGAMRLPAQGHDSVFSYGVMTGRKVNGTVQLILSGNVISGDPVYEFEDTGIYHPDPSQAPRMSLTRTWGNIYGSARRTWRPDGSEKTGFPKFPAGLHWNATTQLLYWTYYDAYNVTGDDDWCLGATRLDPAGPVAYGPWRPSGDGKKGPWRCLRVAEHPSGELLCGSSILSGASKSPWGPDLWVGQFPTGSTPSGFGAPDVPIQKYLTYYPISGQVNSDGTYSGQLRSFRRPGDYFFEPIAGAGGLNQIDPQRNGGVGSWTELDSVSGMTWIDLPDAHGVLFTGRLGSGHLWYRNAGMGNLLCTHGQASPVDVTGPVSTDAYPTIIIYDPNDLDGVRAGLRVDYTIDPVHIINAQASFGLTTAPIATVGASRTLGGTYFDPATRKLYVAAPGADLTIPGLAHPLVHVFRVA